MQVRRVSERDFDAWPDLLDLLHAAFAPQVGMIDPPSSLEAMTAADLRSKSQSEDLFILTPPLCGCVFGQAEADHYYLGKWAVAPSRQGQGLGRLLLDAAETRAAQLGLPTLRLSSRVELATTHKAFVAMGFARIGATRHPGFDRDTSLIFEKRIDRRSYISGGHSE